MKEKYTIQKDAFNMVQILLDNKPFCLLTSELDASKVLSALRLYDILKKEFSGVLENVESKIPKNNFVEYIGLGSSWIVKLGYERSTGRMKVTKKDSTIAPEVTFIHKGVPEGVFKRVLKPDAENGFSVGAAYNNLVRGKYELEQK